MKKKTGIALLGAWIAAKVGLFKIVGLLVLEDAFAMHLGSANGFTFGNLVLASGFGLLIWHHFDKKKRGGR